MRTEKEIKEALGMILANSAMTIKAALESSTTPEQQRMLKAAVNNCGKTCEVLAWALGATLEPEALTVAKMAEETLQKVTDRKLLDIMPKKFKTFSAAAEDFLGAYASKPSKLQKNAPEIIKATIEQVKQNGKDPVFVNTATAAPTDALDAIPTDALDAIMKDVDDIINKITEPKEAKPKKEEEPEETESKYYSPTIEI